MQSVSPYLHWSTQLQMSALNVLNLICALFCTQHGVFSSGKGGEISSWRSRTSNPAPSSAIIPAENRSEIVRKTVYITDVDQQVRFNHALK